MPGRHNVQNALAAVGVAVEMGCADDVIRTGFAKFGGVKRRFTKVGEVDGVTVIDDYGHHPVEIRAVLAAAREGVHGRVIAVVQPHRFTRLRDHMDDFQAPSTMPTWSMPRRSIRRASSRSRASIPMRWSKA
jgi:UDP-N-acetylmuramate--alanine ligase